jgi:hypothetical protein
MSYLTIDTDPTPDYYDQLTQLDGREYLLEFYWSTREGAWYLNILDQNETPIALWLKVVVGWPLLYGQTDPRLPPGQLVAFDMSGAQQEIVDKSDLNTRVLLTYITGDDDDIAAADRAFFRVHVGPSFAAAAGEMICSANGDASNPQFVNTSPVRNPTNAPVDLIVTFAGRGDTTNLRRTRLRNPAEPDPTKPDAYLLPLEGWGSVAVATLSDLLQLDMAKAALNLGSDL